MPLLTRRPRARSFLARLLPAPALALALLSGPAAPTAQTLPDKEYQVKAVFLFNFTQFVDWPAEAFSAADTPLTIGILGPDPFAQYLDDVVRGEKAGTHPILVKRLRRLEEARDCQMIFFAGSESQKPEAALTALKDRKVLTVGDSQDFSRRGGMIDFIMKQGKIRFEINVENARAADLAVSSKLLKLADIVEPGKG